MTTGAMIFSTRSSAQRIQIPIVRGVHPLRSWRSWRPGNDPSVIRLTHTSRVVLPATANFATSRSVFATAEIPAVLLRWVLSSHRATGTGSRRRSTRRIGTGKASPLSDARNNRCTTPRRRGPLRTVRKIGLDVPRRRRSAQSRSGSESGDDTHLRDARRGPPSRSSRTASGQSHGPLTTQNRYVTEALAALTSAERLACVWRIAGFSNEDIATQLGTTSDDVDTTLRKAVNLIRRRLRGEP